MYMVTLSFMTRAETWGVVPVHPEELRRHHRAGVFEHVLGVPKAGGHQHGADYRHRLPFGYFMAKLGPKWKKRTMLLLMIPFWTKLPHPAVRVDHHFRAGGCSTPS